MINILKTLIKKSLIYLKLSKIVIIQISSNIIILGEYKHYGEYATNISLNLKKKYSLIFSMNLTKYLHSKLIRNIIIITPGYINFTLQSNNSGFLTENILKSYTKIPYITKKIKPSVLIEIVSANPTGPLHAGHARGAFISDTLSNLYKYMGYCVRKEYYINNIGKQITRLGKSVNKIYLKKNQNLIKISGDQGYYKNNIINNAANYLYNAQPTYKKIFRGHWLIKCVLYSINNNLIDILKTLRISRIKITSLFEEKILYQNNNVKIILKVYAQRNIIYYKGLSKYKENFRVNSKAYLYAYMQKGGWFLRTILYGDNKDKIILRYNNTPVYLLADIAYHDSKIYRGYKKIINILGADHSGHIISLYAGIKILHILPEKYIDNILVQMVNFIRNKKKTKFSKRKNIIYSFSDIVKKTGELPLRYTFLSKSISTHFSINLNKGIKGIESTFLNLFNVININKLVIRIKLLFENSICYNYLKYNNFIFYKPLKKIHINIIYIVLYFPYIIEISFLRKTPHLILNYINKITHVFYTYIKLFRMTDTLNIELIINAYIITSIKKIITNGLYLLGIIYK